MIKSKEDQTSQAGNGGGQAGERVTITIDDQQIETEAGRNLVQVARENGTLIPSRATSRRSNRRRHRRVHADKNGARRGRRARSPCVDGTVVQASTEELRDARAAIVEMMFSEGNHFCPSCQKSGDCDLQHMGYELGLSVSRFPHLFKDRLIDFNARRIIMEHNRCIKRLRCVREVFTDDGRAVFSFRYRGNETRVGIDYDEASKELTDEQVRDAMHLCPTGAIIVRGEVQARPFGDRQFDMRSMQREYTAQEPVLVLPKEKKTIATISLAGCFGCHMSLLDIDLNSIPDRDRELQ